MSMKAYNKKDKHPLAINVLKLQRYNFEFLSTAEVVFFEYIVVKGMAFKSRSDFFHSSETIRKETGIKKCALRTIINRFVKLEIIEVEVRGFPSVKHFKVNYPKIFGLRDKIYQLEDYGKLSDEFEQQLTDYFLPLIDNYLKKNINKNNEKEKKKKDINDNALEGDISSFNKFLSFNKYKYHIHGNALKYEKEDLIKALEYYEFDQICNYVGLALEYHEREFSLRKFFKFDNLDPVKIIFIEKESARKEEYLDTVEKQLQQHYKDRIEQFNGHTNEYDKPLSRLVITIKDRHNIDTFLNVRTELEFFNAFDCYVDNILNNFTRPKKIIPYFLSKKNEEYVVINHHLSIFNATYTIRH